MGWGAPKGASEKDAVMYEFADLLNGLNSTGDISYKVYSELFDNGMELLEKMYELGKNKSTS